MDNSDKKSGLHVSFVPDGNRRFAKLNNKTVTEIYEHENTLLEKVIFELDDFPEVSEITFYVCSRDNLTKRNPEYILTLFNFLRQQCNKWLTRDCSFKLKCVGSYKQHLPEDLIELLNKLEEKTQDNTRRRINLAIGYDGQQEIVDAVQELLKTGTTIDTEAISKALSVNRPIDLVIRTGKEKRTSSFFPWQTVYSEWFFEDIMWPEFTIDDFRRILKEFNQRERRFGK